VVEVHKFVGFIVVACFTVGWMWGLIAWIARRDPVVRFWLCLSFAQVVGWLEEMNGVAVYLSGRRAPTVLHYAYGIFPLVAFAIAHLVARRLDFRERPWVVFAWVAFICFGLTLRAVMTGFSA
jgi:hypothetical protein